MRPISLILVDDHKLVRQGLRSLFSTNPQFKILGEADDGQEALRLMEDLKPDVAILDVMMPNLNGIEVVKQAAQRGLKTSIVFLTMHNNPTYAVRALRSGALGYVLKESDFSEIVQAVVKAAQGKRYLSAAISDEVLQMLLEINTSSQQDSLDMLSPRERGILQLIAEGNTNAMIASKLTLSIRTVEAHRAHIMSKLRLTSHADLVKFAVNQGLVTP